MVAEAHGSRIYAATTPTRAPSSRSRCSDFAIFHARGLHEALPQPAVRVASSKMRSGCHCTPTTHLCFGLSYASTNQGIPDRRWLPREKCGPVRPRSSPRGERCSAELLCCDNRKEFAILSDVTGWKAWRRPPACGGVEVLDHGAAGGNVENLAAATQMPKTGRFTPMGLSQADLHCCGGRRWCSSSAPSCFWPKRSG